MLENRKSVSAPRTHPLRGGLGRKILAWFLVLSLLPLFLSNSVGYGVSRRIIEENARRYLLTLAEVQADHVAHQVEVHQLNLEAMVASSRFLEASIPAASAAVESGRLRDPAVTALGSYLTRKHEIMSELSELYVLDETGRVVGGTRRERVGADLSESRLYSSAMEGRFFEGAWEDEDGTTRSMFLVAMPIRGDREQVLGVIGATVRPEEQPEFLNLAGQAAGDVESYILYNGGHPLFVSNPDAPVDYGRPIPSPLVDLPPGSSARYVNYEGVDVIGISRSIQGIPWLYVAELPARTAFGQLRNLRLLFAALAGVFALVLFGIAWLVAGSIVSPLRRLVLAADRIRGGDLEAQVRVDSGDELGELSDTFNQMARGLRESAAEIHDLHAQDMRRAAQLASVGELAAGIAHEIKNPLAGATSGVDMLERELEPGTPSQSLLKQVRTQLQRIESALRDLLSYARPKPPTVGWVMPGQLVERTVELVGPQSEAAGVTIELLAPGETGRVRVDPELLTQALVNLCLNGIQAMPAGGVLRIGVEQSEEEIHMTVEDSGEGIPESEMNEIFRPFFTTKHRGTGLGLAITRSIVERHDGRLEVESVVGRGSCFTLVLPAAGMESTA